MAPDYLLLENGDHMLLETGPGAILLEIGAIRMDSLLLFPPGASGLASAWASTIQLGSWLDISAGVDFGARGLIRSIQSGNALTDGGRFGSRYAPLRHMAIPLIVNTPSVVNWEGALARAANPGAIIAVQPETVPSAQAVYFDVVDGRWEPDYNTFHNRAGVRKGVLYLETQPWGYWPTEILLASAASIGQFGQLAVNGASVIGDVPPVAHLRMQPTAASVYQAGSWYPDTLAWSFAGRPSLVPLLAPSQWVAATSQFSYGPSFAASVAADVFAPASQAMVFSFPLASQNTFWGYATAPWTMLAETATWAIPSGLEPAYRGRFRAFGFFRVTPSTAGIGQTSTGSFCASAPYWQVMVDTEPFVPGIEAAMASANQIATAINYFPTGNQMNQQVTPSPAYLQLDLGELTLPALASGQQQPQTIRLWAQPPPYLWSGSWANSQGSAVQLQFGGLFLLPVDGAAGVLARGLTVPTIGGADRTISFASQAASYIVGALELNRGFVDSVLISAASVMAQDARANHRGVTPRLGASTTSLTILTGDRPGAATYPVVNANFEYAQVSVSYRPTFQWLYGV